jgi:metal transporter CNNM
VIVTNLQGEPIFVLDSHYFLRDALFNQLESAPNIYWHRPIIVRNMQTRLGEVIGRMTVAPERPGDDVIHHDMILVWGAQRRIITGSDLLGRLLRGIATVEKPADAAQSVASAPNQTMAAAAAITAASQQISIEQAQIPLRGS